MATPDYRGRVAVILACGLSGTAITFILVALADAVAGTDVGISENATQVIIGITGGIVGILGGYIGALTAHRTERDGPEPPRWIGTTPPDPDDPPPD